MDAKARAANGIPDFDNEETKAKIAKVQKLAELTSELGENITLGQMMLAWTLKNPNVSTVITGASRPEQIRENFKAVEILPKLDDAFMERVDKILGNKPEGLQSFGRWV
jgi:aryl-alcohol dehydrogenase-like predicted oxidoreductase